MIYLDHNGNLNLSKLHPAQREFVQSTALHTGLIGGYQSGKSAAAVAKVITKLLTNPHASVAYYLPTYRLISDMLVPKLSQALGALGIGYKHNVKDSYMATPYGRIMMRSLENPDSIVSYSVAYSLVDEFDVVPPARMKLAQGRISSRNSWRGHTKNQIDYVSTPEGFGFAYNFFVKNANDNKKLLKISTLDNLDNLADSYVDGLREAYTEDQLRAYLNGDFVNLYSGSIYGNYDRDLNGTSATIEKREPLHIGLDFNIGHMAAVVHVIRGGRPMALAELVDVYDTPAMIEQLKVYYGEHPVTIYPDAAGAARSSSGKSDHALIKEAGYTINAPKANPAVKDRINAVNKALKNGLTGERAYKVNADACPRYAAALEQQTYRNGAPDKLSGLDHITDAGGYFISRRFGIKPKRRGAR